MRLFLENRKIEKGFTLVELLIVIAIIAILAAIAIPQFSKYRLRGYKNTVDSDAKNIYTAAEAYLSDNSSSTITNLAQLQTGGYLPSTDVVFVVSDLSLTSGSATIYSSMLNASAKDNIATIYYNGRIDQPAMP